MEQIILAQPDSWGVIKSVCIEEKLSKIIDVERERSPPSPPITFHPGNTGYLDMNNSNTSI